MRTRRLGPIVWRPEWVLALRAVPGLCRLPNGPAVQVGNRTGFQPGTAVTDGAVPARWLDPDPRAVARLSDPAVRRVAAVGYCGVPCHRSGPIGGAAGTLRGGGTVVDSQGITASPKGIPDVGPRAGGLHAGALALPLGSLQPCVPRPGSG